MMVEQDLTIDPDPGSNVPRPAPVTPSGKERRLGDYRILREIGRGGMGGLRGRAGLARPPVALKVPPGHVASDRVALARFRREAKAAARLHHTNIAPVFEVGRDGEVAYYAIKSRELLPFFIVEIPREIGRSLNVQDSGACAVTRTHLRVSDGHRADRPGSAQRATRETDSFADQ